MEPNYDAIPMTALTAKISVYTACACDVCTDPKKRWFDCSQIRTRYITTYDAPRHYVDCLIVPTRAAVQWVQAQHPSCVLVYVDVNE